MQREIRITGDGYPTFLFCSMNIYHSIHGAAQESMHVFIQSGLLYQIEQGRKNTTAGSGTASGAQRVADIAGCWKNIRSIRTILH